MRRLLAALLVSLFAALPAAAHTHEPLQAAASAVGADVDVEEYVDTSLNAGFLPAGTYCVWFYCQTLERPKVIFMGDWTEVPFEIRYAVLLHELGHYRQAVEGRPFDEWDADLYAANTLCRQGRDGVDLWRRAGMMFLARSGHSWGHGHGDGHGSWYERVENVKANAKACRRETEAP